MKNILLVILFGITLQLLNSQTISFDSRFNFFCSNPDDGRLVYNYFIQYEKCFNDYFNYNPNKQLDITIFSSVDKMTGMFSIKSFIGGYFTDNKIFLQPINILIKRNVLEKVIFTEYAHYYLYYFTNTKINGAFNEMLTYFYYINFVKKSGGKFRKIILLNNVNEINDFNKIINSKEKLEEFYYISYHFISFIKNKYNNSFDIIILNELRKNDFNSAIKKITGLEINDLYKEFVDENNK